MGWEGWAGPGWVRAEGGRGGRGGQGRGQLQARIKTLPSGLVWLILRCYPTVVAQASNLLQLHMLLLL